MEDYDNRPKRPSRTQSAVVIDEEKDETKTDLSKEKLLFIALIIAWEILIVILYAVWVVYVEDETLAEWYTVEYYDYFRDVNVMIFIGFAYLMTFLRRYGFSAIGYTLLLSAMVCQWSVVLDCFAVSQDPQYNKSIDAMCEVETYRLLHCLFASAAVMISYGAVLGKATPAQLLVMAFMEPMFFWLNIYLCLFPSQIAAYDIGGGMVIHVFGCYFGLAVTWFLTSRHTRGHEDNTSCYSSDIFALIGTLFLWIMWPSFNAAIAPSGVQRQCAIVNTFLSLCASVAASFVFSRLLENKFEVVHVQNSTIAGGVVMGVAAHLEMSAAGALGCGWLAGTASVFGYVYLSPWLNNKLGIQDICGVHNLHGIPGLMGSFLAVFLAISDYQGELLGGFTHGDQQAGYQMAATVTSVGMGIVGGIVTGAIMKAVDSIQYVNAKDFFNDRTWWSLPSDYEHVVRSGKEE
jgi:ammonium transporter Rh